jgi:WD40 repeat protein/serine/threonine protein kinase
MSYFMAVETNSPSARERELFLGALEKSAPGERTAYLEAACGADAALRQRIEDLLKEQEDVGSFLEAPALSGTPLISGPGGTELAGAVTEKPGDRIGRYKLLQKIGEGGCGVVYMAEQEEPVRRRVALKVIKLGMDTKSVIARFEAERQALAMMDHPNIAKVLDAGATETGRPFFVMELVRGIRITDYCDENNLSTEQRLALFVQVCHAIQHAHQKGIIHRDIKPSNLLVTLHDSVPVPKVIDFGIAKATEQRLTDKTLFTQFTAFIGTPAYMSPEQAEMSGLDIDTRSDIYSLGVLLYELLTGKTPFDAEGLLRSGLDACRRTIREQEPVRPSTRVATMIGAELTTTAEQRRTEAAKLIHSLRGDLDWIVMKCLEKDRTRRYDTANDVVQDVERYLENEPVLARPPSNVYRLQKLFRRYRGAVAAAAAIAATLLLGMTFSTWQAVRATRAEHRAETSQRQETVLRRLAEQEEAGSQLNEYVADINLAQQSVTAGNLGRAVQLLDKHRPQHGAPDLRGFEWRYLWQLCQGDQHTSLPPQDGPVQSIAVSPDGNLLALGVHQEQAQSHVPGRLERNLWVMDMRDRVSIWDLRTRTLLTKLSKPAYSMLFLPDGKSLASSHLATVRIWHTSNWTEQTALSEKLGGFGFLGEGGRFPMEGSRLSIALSADGARLASANRDGVRLWDTAKWRQMGLFTNTFGPMAFSPDGKTLAADTRDGITLFPLVRDGNPVVLEDSTNLFFRSGPRFLSDRVMIFSPDSKFVVAARNTLSERGVFVLSVWDAQTGREIETMPRRDQEQHTGAISSMAFSPDGNTLATASLDYSIALWDFAKRQRITTLQGHLSEVWAVAFSPDGQTVISAAKDGSVNFWPARPQAKDDSIAGQWQTLSFSKDGQSLAALNREGVLAFINVATREPEQQLQLQLNPMRFRPPGSVSISADFSTLAQPLNDGSVKIWNLQTHDSTVLKVSRGAVEFALLSPDGGTLITGGRNHTLRCWDLSAGTNVAIGTNIHKAVLSPDARTLVAFGEGDTLELWDFPTRSLRASVSVEAQLGAEPSFSKDSRLLAVICPDDMIRVLNTVTGRWLGVFSGHKQSVSSVAFSPDAKTLASSSEDSTLKLWNVATQQELFTIRRLGGAPRGLMFSPDGRVLAAGSGFFALGSGLRFYQAPLLSEADSASTKTAAVTSAASGAKN